MYNTINMLVNADITTCGLITCHIFSKFIYNAHLETGSSQLTFHYAVGLNFVICHTQPWQNAYELSRFVRSAERGMTWGGGQGGLSGRTSYKADFPLDKWESVYVSWGFFLKYSSATFTRFLWESRYALEKFLEQSSTSNTKQNSSPESPRKASQVAGEHSLL